MRDIDLDYLNNCKELCRQSLPSQKYEVIEVDPPWDYNNGAGDRFQGKVPYPSLTEAQLADLPVGSLAAPTCVLFLWATGPMLETAIRCIKYWGFRYVTVQHVWLKLSSKSETPVVPCGQWARASCEFLLVGVKGSGYMKWKPVGHPATRQLLAVRRGAHSAKPLQAIQRMTAFFDFPGIKRLSMFARTDQPTFMGWDVWGLEINGFYLPAVSQETLRHDGIEDEDENERRFATA